MYVRFRTSIVYYYDKSLLNHFKGMYEVNK